MVSTLRPKLAFEYGPQLVLVGKKSPFASCQNRVALVTDALTGLREAAIPMVSTRR